MESQARRRNADRILYEMGLLDMLREIGTPHVTGSYQMDMMAWNDLDVNIENEGMTLTKLYRLTGQILETFRPLWYEAKEERTPEGKTVWFHGFEAMVGGGLWNVDLWFFDQETIAEAERYCLRIAGAASAAQKEQIIAVKRGLLERNLYAFDKFRSMDVDRAVLEGQVRDVNEFLERYGHESCNI